MRFLILLLPIFAFANECLSCHKIDLKSHAPVHYNLNKEISLTLKAWGLKEHNYTLQNLPKSGFRIKDLGARDNSLEQNNTSESLKIANPVTLNSFQGLDLASRNSSKLVESSNKMLKRVQHDGVTSHPNSSFLRTKKSKQLNTKNSTLKTNLAVDFLRRKCLQCHLTSKRVNPTNNACLACHSPHTSKNDSFKAKATQQKCLKCHNGNFIGTDFLGLFPHDFDESYRAPIGQDGFYPKRLGGIDYHHLIKDIHAKKGLTCISCHNSKNGNFEKSSCISCHQNISKQNHPKYHSKISCVACHSAWQINSYKSIILRSDTPNYKEFERLTLSQDPYLEKFLQKALVTPNIAPAMPDFVDNTMHKGLWYLGYEFRRWENFYLINYKGKIELARPLLDFELTYVNDKNKTVIDAKKFGGFVVTKPHTIIKEAKSCESCHANSLNLNDTTLINYKLLKGNLIEGTNLTNEQIERLKSKKYKLFRAKELFKR